MKHTSQSSIQKQKDDVIYRRLKFMRKFRYTALIYLHNVNTFDTIFCDIREK